MPDIGLLILAALINYLLPEAAKKSKQLIVALIKRLKESRQDDP